MYETSVTYVDDKGMCAKCLYKYEANVTRTDDNSL